MCRWCKERQQKVGSPTKECTLQKQKHEVIGPIYTAFSRTHSDERNACPLSCFWSKQEEQSCPYYKP